MLWGGRGPDRFEMRDAGSIDRIADFDPGSDTLVLDTALRNGGVLSAQQVVDLYVDDLGGDLRLSFDEESANPILLMGLLDMTGLANAIEIP